METQMFPQRDNKRPLVKMEVNQQHSVKHTGIDVDAGQKQRRGYNILFPPTSSGKAIAFVPIPSKPHRSSLQSTQVMLKLYKIHRLQPPQNWGSHTSKNGNNILTSFPFLCYM